MFPLMSGYHIAAVARMTGLSADAIRAWERRYRIVEPERDRAGLRLYSDEDVARLRLARAATALGHPIRDVAQMSNGEIERLTAAGAQKADVTHGAIVEKLLGAIRKGDADAAADLLASAALLLPARSLALDVLAPVLREAGAQWERGRMAVWQEHLLSGLVRKTASAIARSRQGGAAMLFATPPFELHEFGISLAGMIAASQGNKAISLGSAVPADELAYAVRGLEARIVVVGMTWHAVPPPRAAAYVKELDERLRGSIEIWLGGALGAEVAAHVELPRVRPVHSLEEFEQMLV